MKIKISGILSIVGLFLFLLPMSACKGRTIEKVEPKGDTVEVVINPDVQVDDADTMPELSQTETNNN